MSIDHLSALPEFLLLYILNFLKLREAVATSVLSKQWRYLWAESPRLNFRESSRETEKIRKFVSLIRAALLNRTLNHLVAFWVEFEYDECLAPDVDFWLQFVANYKTQTVRLLLNSDKHFYELPQVMYLNSSLHNLYLKRCTLAPPDTINWSSLHSLEIADAVLPQNVIDQLLSNCPVLNSLRLDRCWGFSRLDIKSKRLYSLQIQDCSVEKLRAPFLEISAPYLSSLIIKRWHPDGRKLHLNSILSLYADIEFFFFGTDAPIPVEIMSAVRQLLQQVKHVQDLTLGPSVIEIASRMVASGRQLQLLRVETLCIHNIASRSVPVPDFSGVVGVLESSPNLEDLTLYSGSFSSDEDITWGAAVRDDLVRDLCKLKTVEIVWHGCGIIEPLLTLTRVLLKRAIVLEKMEILLVNCSPACIAETTQKLQNYPRSSQGAQILFLL